MIPLSPREKRERDSKAALNRLCVEWGYMLHEHAAYTIDEAVNVLLPEYGGWRLGEQFEDGTLLIDRARAMVRLLTIKQRAML